MNALLSHESQTLYSEVSSVPFIEGKRISLLCDFLSSKGIYSLSDVTKESLSSYVQYIKRSFPFDKNRYSAYKGDLETVIFYHMKKTGTPLSTAYPFADSPRGRKALVYLYASGIETFGDISASLRKSYSEYLALSVPTKHSEYLKQLDLMYLTEVKSHPFTRTPTYRGDLLYLGYYPDAEIAEKFYYTQKKDFLYFDFSLPAPETAKKQIFKMLTNDLTNMAGLKNHLLIQHYITPLYYLLSFISEYRIADIKKITSTEEELFSDFLKRNMASYNKNAYQVLFRIRRFLFLSEEKPDFGSTLWFLERFNLSDRLNPARPIITYSFADVASSDRPYFQHFMKYLIVLSPKYSVRYINRKYYAAKDFICFLESRHSCLSELSYSDIECYIDKLDSQDLDPFTFNSDLAMLSFFLTVMSVRENLLIPSFPFEYFYKKAFKTHLDRSVPESDIDKILSVLYDFPETLGLMFLVLYSTGLRINEVCTLKKDAFLQNKGTYWIKIFQYKLMSDKEIPIPDELARLLLRHIKADTSYSEYVFPSCKYKDKPYGAGTFTKQMKAQLLLYEQTKDIRFRSHDYRHTIATDLHESGSPLGATRAFLGHNKDDMTKQYIDHLPGKIDLLQETYFKENPIDETKL